MWPNHTTVATYLGSLDTQARTSCSDFIPFLLPSLVLLFQRVTPNFCFQNLSHTSSKHISEYLEFFAPKCMGIELNAGVTALKNLSTMRAEQLGQHFHTHAECGYEMFLVSGVQAPWLCNICTSSWQENWERNCIINHTRNITV